EDDFFAPAEDILDTVSRTGMGVEEHHRIVVADVVCESNVVRITKRARALRNVVVHPGLIDHILPHRLLNNHFHLPVATGDGMLGQLVPKATENAFVSKQPWRCHRWQSARIVLETADDCFTWFNPERIAFPARFSFDFQKALCLGRKVVELKYNAFERIAGNANAPVNKVAGTARAAVPEFTADGDHRYWIKCIGEFDASAGVVVDAGRGGNGRRDNGSDY